MMRHYVILLGLALTNGVLHAQSVQCTSFPDGSMQCNGTTGLVVVPNYTAQAAQQFATGLGQLLGAIRQGQAQRQLQEQEAARQQAMVQLFTERAKDILAYIVATERLEGVVGKKFLDDCASSLEALYRINPMASQPQMLEVVIPHYREMQQGFANFVQRALSPIADSLHSIGVTLPDDKRQSLAAELNAAMTSLYMNRPDATADDLRKAFQPILARYQSR